MKQSTGHDKHQQEIKDLLDKLTELLKNSDKEIQSTDVKPIYTLIHEINETTLILGVNSISNLFSPIEKNISDKVKKSWGISPSETAVIISTIGLCYSVLTDTSLTNPNLKSSYEALKEQVINQFEASEQEVSEEDSFSVGRFQEVFVEEANDLINQLEEKLLQLESEMEDLSIVDDVFRIMHTLKGNSNMFGHTHLGEITHHLENVYDEIRGEKLKINRNILDITLQCVDHFRNLIEDSQLSDQTNKVIHENILNDITEVLEADEPEEDKMNDDTKKDDRINTFYLFFKPQSDIFDDGTNPLYFVYDLQEMGECVVVPVTSEELAKDGFDPEKCYTQWHILLVTKESADTIADNFIFLREESQPAISLLGEGNLLKKPQYVDRFKKEAAASESSVAEKLVQAKVAVSSKAVKEAKKSVKAKTTESSITSIRVASAKIDLMMNLISELVTKQAELSMLASENEINQLQEVAESIESISRDLRDNAFSISLIPLDKTVLRFQRLVRDVSAKFNKQVDFVVEGKETELDKTVIEKIVDPLMHILRNSIDHGIETPEERRELGKPEHGVIKLKAYPSGAHVVIEISDDGSGINLEKVRKVAIKKGYIKEQDEFTVDDMLRLILQPGFSTTENVSEVSGRGVGMDVVNQKIMEIRGELDVKTSPGFGTTITIKLPLTISIIDSLLVMIGETYYLIPLSVVERCAEVKTEVVTENKNKYINLDEQFIPIIDLHDEFDIQEERLDYQRLILVNYKDMLVALIVDQIMGNHQAVLKSLGQAYRRQEIISGASILGNGEIALVLDTNKLVQEYMMLRNDEMNKINLLNSQVKETVR